MDEHLYALEKKIDALTQLLNQREPQYPNYTGESLSYIGPKQIQQPSSIDGLWNEVKKDKRECNNMLLRIKEENLDPTVVEEKKNEYANEVELTMEMRKGEEQHQQTKIENVLVGIDKFNFPIDLVILGNEENKQAVSTKRPFNALSRAWIDTENGEMTLLVGKEKVKFNLHQSIHLTDEEKNFRMRIESSLQHFGRQPKND